MGFMDDWGEHVEKVSKGKGQFAIADAFYPLAAIGKGFYDGATRRDPEDVRRSAETYALANQANAIIARDSHRVRERKRLGHANEESGDIDAAILWYERAGDTENVERLRAERDWQPQPSYRPPPVLPQYRPPPVQPQVHYQQPNQPSLIRPVTDRPPLVRYVAHEEFEQMRAEQAKLAEHNIALERQIAEQRKIMEEARQQVELRTAETRRLTYELFDAAVKEAKQANASVVLNLGDELMFKSPIYVDMSGATVGTFTVSAPDSIFYKSGISFWQRVGQTLRGIVTSHESRTKPPYDIDVWDISDAERKAPDLLGNQIKKVVLPFNDSMLRGPLAIGITEILDERFKIGELTGKVNRIRAPLAV